MMLYKANSMTLTPDELSTINAAVALVPDLAKMEGSVSNFIGKHHITKIIAALSLAGKLVEPIQEHVKINRKADTHEELWLEPECCADPYTGRMWAQDDVGPCPDCGEPWVKYVIAAQETGK